MLFEYYEIIRMFLFTFELILFIILIPSFIYYIYTSLKENKNLKTEILSVVLKHKILITITIIMSIISIIDVICKFTSSNHIIGSFYEEENYIDTFYVLVSDMPFDEDGTIKRLPAIIHSVRGGLENNSYYLKSLIINNEQIDFEPSQAIFLSSDNEVYDIEDNQYYVQLTRNRVTQ